MRTIGVVTVSRSDYGIYLPILRRIRQDRGLRLHLIVGGMHLSPEFGLTVNAIEADGFEIGDRVDMLLSSDAPEGIAKSMGLGTIGFAGVFARSRPDILLVLGDRFDMFAAVVAALPFAVPVAHIHGGESTEGLIDEAIRHSITKMSHLHFVSTPGYAERVIRMGEEPWRVVVSGAPALDNLKELELLGEEEVNRRFHLDAERPLLLVTFHPVTLEYGETAKQLEELLAALGETDAHVLFTHPNADTSGRRIIERVQEFTRRRPNAQVVVNAGTQAYFSLMRRAQAMVGNSSSGIIEAASFELPVVNIGARQRGRVHGPNVLDAQCRAAEIRAALRKAMSREFRNRLRGIVNPYGDGQAARRIVEKLKDVRLDGGLLKKRFYDGGTRSDAHPLSRRRRLQPALS